MVPTAKAEEIGVRNVIDKSSADKVIGVLRARRNRYGLKTGTRDIETTWKK